MSTLLILGAGGHAKVVAETALASGAASRVTFLDDSTNAPLAQALEPATREQFAAAAVAIGHAATRLHWLEQLSAAGYALPVLIHPTAWVSPSASLGPGSVVFAQAAVQAQAAIGHGAILNTGSSADHNVHLADGVHVCPGARLAGEVQVGARSWIGIGAAVIQQVRIGTDVTVGAGAAVVRDLPDGVTAVGVPARILDKP